MINIEELLEENNRLKKENDLLKEELKELKDGIIGIYNNMNSLEIINKHEMEDIEII
jgi:cell division septum initiation protein DivIVA